MRSGKADLGISAISITAERDRQFDFSQPMLEAGLQILVRGNGETGPSNPLLEFLRLLTSPTIAVWLGIAALLIVVPAHIVWLVERRHGRGSSRTGATSRDLPRHVVGGVNAGDAGRADAAPLAGARHRDTLDVHRRRVRRVLYRAADRLADGPADPRHHQRPRRLAGKASGDDAQTRGATYLRQKNVDVVEVARIDDAYAALLDKQVDAVVLDAPVLRYYAAHDGKGRVHLVEACSARRITASCSPSTARCAVGQ